MKTNQLLRMVAGIGYGVIAKNFLPVATVGLLMLILTPIVKKPPEDVLHALGSFAIPAFDLIPFAGFWYGKNFTDRFPYFWSAASITSLVLHLKTNATTPA